MLTSPCWTLSNALFLPVLQAACQAAALGAMLCLHSARAALPCPAHLPWLYDRALITLAWVCLTAIACLLQVKKHETRHPDSDSCIVVLLALNRQEHVPHSQHLRTPFWRICHVSSSTESCHEISTRPNGSPSRVWLFHILLFRCCSGRASIISRSSMEG